MIIIGEYANIVDMFNHMTTEPKQYSIKTLRLWLLYIILFSKIRRT